MQWAGDIDQLLHGQCSVATTISVTLSADVESEHRCVLIFMNLQKFEDFVMYPFSPVCHLNSNVCQLVIASEF